MHQLKAPAKSWNESCVRDSLLGDRLTDWMRWRRARREERGNLEGMFAGRTAYSRRSCRGSIIQLQRCRHRMSPQQRARWAAQTAVAHEPRDVILQAVGAAPNPAGKVLSRERAGETPSAGLPRALTSPGRETSPAGAGGAVSEQPRPPPGWRILETVTTPV